MIFGIVLLFLIYIVWLLLVKGYLFKLIICGFGWFGLYIFLEKHISPHSGVMASNHLFSYSVIIPTILVVLTMAFTYKE